MPPAPGGTGASGPRPLARLPLVLPPYGRRDALDRDQDGQVHFAILPGSVAKNRHLLDRTVA